MFMFGKKGFKVAHQITPGSGIVLVLLFASGLAQAQFNSGSTGADGALDLSTMTCPGNVCMIQLPESGVLNYTTVNIPTGKYLRFRINSRNTPAVILAQGPVTIAGQLTVSAAYTRYGGSCGGGPVFEGPGGFRGSTNGQGFGPGGGTPTSPNGKWVGPLSLTPIVGGSGPYGNGFGGGAVVVASSSSITLSGQIVANGDAENYCNGTYGSGGAIRLVSQALNISGSLSACGANCTTNGGVIRLEAPAANRNITGTTQPAAVISEINPTIIASSLPRLSLTSVGGFAVPLYSGSRFDLVDILLPIQLTDPISVGVSAENVPVGTQVSVGFASSSGGTSVPCNLAGSFSSSSCTATISGLNRTAVTYLLATATFSPSGSLAQYNPMGPNHVAKIKLETAIAAKPKYSFIRSNGSVIDPKDISPAFLKEFGM